MSAKKCLIFGGAGFIGSHLTKALVVEGHDVTVFARPHHVILTPGVRIVHGDFMSAHDIDYAIAGNDYVFHLISMTTPASSDEDPYTDIETNVRMSIHLLESCVKHNVKRVLYTSTGGAIYGKSEKELLSENDMTEPISPYGIGKATVEGYLRYFQIKHGLDYITFRVSNAYGPGQNVARNNHGVIPIFLSHILADEKLTVMGDGTMARDYIHVNDLVDFLTEVFSGQHDNYVYNVGPGVGTSINELINLISDITKRSIRVNHIKAPESYVSRIVLDTSRVNSEFGPIASTDLHTGVNDLYEIMKKSK